MSILNPFLNGIYESFFVAAIPEEIAKFLVIFFYCSRHPSFDEKMDGLVYGATASLGFAALENIFYVSSYGYSAAITRAFTSVPCHAIFGMLIGYYIAEWKFGEKRAKYLIFKGLLIAIILHGLYDTPLLMQKRALELRDTVSPLFYFFASVASWLIIIRIFRYAFRVIKNVKEQQTKEIDDHTIEEIAAELKKYKNSNT
jgi:RsiW-degrading membrane proteinase PrsW (M82 family)